MLFLSSKNSHFQNKGKCKIFVVEMSCICMRMKNHFHISGFALSLALKQRLLATRKWPLPVKILFHYPPILLFLINAFQMKLKGKGKRAKQVKGESERAPSVTFETQNSKLNHNTCMVLCRKNEGQCVAYKWENECPSFFLAQTDFSLLIRHPYITWFLSRWF